MNQKLRQCLEVKRAKAVHEAAERLAADANADVGEIVRRIETYAKLLAAHLDLTIPETIAFRVDGDAHVPTRVRLRPQEPWVLRDLGVQELRFSQETPAEPGAVAFVPAIMQGLLTLHDVSETITLREKERLSLTGVDGRVVELRAHDAINLIFEGTARTIDIGPTGFERHLTPTYLAYLYHQKPLAFF